MNGTRFQLDVASPILKDKYFDNNGGSGTAGSDDGSGDKAAGPNGSRSNESRVPQPTENLATLEKHWIIRDNNMLWVSGLMFTFIKSNGGMGKNPANYSILQYLYSMLQ